MHAPPLGSSADLRCCECATFRLNQDRLLLDHFVGFVARAGKVLATLRPSWAFVGEWATMSSLSTFFFGRLDEAGRRGRRWKAMSENDHQCWFEKAAMALLKRVHKSDKRMVEDLKNALTQPHLPSRCVTIARTGDGRLQVAHRKGFPHLIACRIWRWPDLCSHRELRSLSICQFSFSHGKPGICINPYHYARVEPAGTGLAACVCSCFADYLVDLLTVGLSLGQPLLLCAPVFDLISRRPDQCHHNARLGERHHRV